MPDIDRPTWDDWYMFMALWVARRSPDPATKHGAIYVNSKNRPLSFGYNGPPHGCNDVLIMSERPLKYYVVIHAEENGIISAGDRDLEGSTVYITGMPCSRCWAKLVELRVRRVVYGPVTSHMIDENDIKARAFVLMNHPNILIEEWKGDVAAIEANVTSILEVLKR